MPISPLTIKISKTHEKLCVADERYQCLKLFCCNLKSALALEIIRF